MPVKLPFLSACACLLLAQFSVALEPIPAMDCIIRPYQSVDLASPVPGVLARLNALESSYIERGAIAAVMDAGVEQASVALAKARSAVTSEVAVTNVNYDFDQRRKKRIDTLYKKQGVSFDIKDQADREFALSRHRLQQAKDLVAIRALEQARAEAQLEQKTIRSPIAGYVVEHYKQPGEYIEQQPIMRIAQLDPLKVETVVPVEFLPQLHLGLAAQVQPESANSSLVTARVTTIDRVADVASGTVGIQLTLANPDLSVLAGVKCVLEFDHQAGPQVTQAKR